jgi:hypothetical protein
MARFKSSGESVDVADSGLLVSSPSGEIKVSSLEFPKSLEEKGRR